MLNADTLIVIGCIALGGATFLRLLGGARMEAVAEAERQIASRTPSEPVYSGVIPEVSGEDPD